MSKRIVLFLLLTGCSYASDGRAIGQLFFFLALFISACTGGGGKFKAKPTPDAPSDTTAPTDSTEPTAPADPLDVTAPTGTVQINDGAALTNLRTVVLSFTTSDDVTQTEMRYGTSPSLADADWVPFDTSIGYMLASGDGIKRVYAQFRDMSGNESDIVSDTIELNEISYGVLTVFAAPGADTFSGPIKAVGDVNGDGKDDLIARLSGDYNSARVVLGGANHADPVTLTNGVRGFALRNGDFARGVANVVSGDVNGDGLSDLALIRDMSYSSSVEVIHGRPATADVDLSVPGDGGLTIQNVYSYYGRDVKLGDVNGDGLDDIVVPQDWNSTVRVVFGSSATGAVSASALTATEFFDISANLQESKYNEEDNVVVLGDFNGDGKQDVFLHKYRGAAYGSTFYPTVVFGDSVTDPVNAAASTARRFVIWGSSNYLGTNNDARPEVGDFNGDGKDDLIFPSTDGSRVTVVFGRAGSGGFGADVYANDPNGLGSDGLIITGDFAPARSSILDVLYTGSQYGSGNNYYTPKTFTDHYYYREKLIEVTDVNGDGKDDIIITGDAYSDQVFVVFGGTATPNYK